MRTAANRLHKIATEIRACAGKSEFAAQRTRLFGLAERIDQEAFALEDEVEDDPIGGGRV